jgi:hypothetical protein
MMARLWDWRVWLRLDGRSPSRQFRNEASTEDHDFEQTLPKIWRMRTQNRELHKKITNI